MLQWLQKLGALGNRQFQEAGEDPVSHLDIDSHVVHIHHHPPESLERVAVILGLPWWLGGKGFCQHRAVGRADSIPGLGKPPGEGIGNPLQYSHLGNPMDKGACPWGCKELDTTEYARRHAMIFLVWIGLFPKVPDPPHLEYNHSCNDSALSLAQKWGGKEHLVCGALTVCL